LVYDDEGQVELVGKRPSKCVAIFVKLLVSCTLLEECLLDE
jgi:hypothetical protein